MELDKNAIEKLLSEVSEDLIPQIEQVKQGLLWLQMEKVAIVFTDESFRQFKNEYPDSYGYKLLTSFYAFDLAGLDLVRSLSKSEGGLVTVVFNAKTAQYDIYKTIYSPFKLKCFIATATYGSVMAPEVIILRRFRDDILLFSKLGTTFVKLYYFVSPPLAILISKHKGLRTVTRLIMLKPVLYFIKKGR
jgi:hypothetical protein